MGIASTHTSRAVFDRTGGDKQLKVYAGFYHELLKEPDGDEVFVVYASPAGHPLCFGVH